MKFHRLSGATFYDCIKTIYQFIKTFVDNKCLFFRNIDPLMETLCFTLYYGGGVIHIA